MAAAQEIWIPRKVHNHDRKSAYRNYGERVNVRKGMDVSDTFVLTNGIKQGCILAPTLFSIFLSAMLEEAFRDMSLHPITPECRPIYSCTLQREDKITNILLRDLLFADDSALISHSAEEIQMIVDAFANASSKFSLKINIKKTEVMFQPNYTTTMEEDITVDETTLNPVQEFTYLGSIIAIYGHIEAEQQKRMSKASMSFGRLRERLWNNHNVSIIVKRKSYRAIILSILLYGAETWTVFRGM